MTLLIFLTSCAFLQGSSSLENVDKEKLLEAVKVTGEGRGRLSMGQSQFVFGFESLLKDNFDWVLAVSIPLHGEEAMILTDLREKQILDSQMESFEMRISKEFKKLKLEQILTAEEFLKELRTLIRFNLATKWGGKRSCQEQQNVLVCELDGESFSVLSTSNELNISKSLGMGRYIIQEAKILKDGSFERTDIRFYSQKNQIQTKNSVLALELFWKN